MAAAMMAAASVAVAVVLAQDGRVQARLGHAGQQRAGAGQRLRDGGGAGAGVAVGGGEQPVGLHGALALDVDGAAAARCDGVAPPARRAAARGALQWIWPASPVEDSTRLAVLTVSPKRQ